MEQVTGFTGDGCQLEQHGTPFRVSIQPVHKRVYPGELWLLACVFNHHHPLCDFNCDVLPLVLAQPG